MKVYLKPWWKNYLPWNRKLRSAMQTLIDYQEEIFGEDIRRLNIKCLLEGRTATDEEIAEIRNKFLIEQLNKLSKEE